MINIFFDYLVFKFRKIVYFLQKRSKKIGIEIDFVHFVRNVFYRKAKMTLINHQSNQSILHIQANFHAVSNTVESQKKQREFF